jgi:hypothetical protein
VQQQPECKLIIFSHAAFFVNMGVFSVVVQFESSCLAIAMEAREPASLKAMPPHSNTM